MLLFNIKCCVNEVYTFVSMYVCSPIPEQLMSLPFMILLIRYIYIHDLLLNLSVEGLVCLPGLGLLLFLGTF